VITALRRCGVNPNLIGMVTRSDVPFGDPVQQVTYAGLPLYRFFLDEVPGGSEGANLFDPVTSPPASGTSSTRVGGSRPRASHKCGSRPPRLAGPGLKRRCWQYP
jgi:hypothetical protein